MSDKTTIPCNYFPELPARWHCPECERNFSAVCIQPLENKMTREYDYLCPLCHGDVESLGIANSIRPFWEVLPIFFKYPLKSDALVYLIFFSLINILSFINPPLGFITFSIASYALLMYAFKCLNHTARGHMEPPGVMDSYHVVNKMLIIKQLFVFALLGLFVFVIQRYLGNIASIIGLLFVLIGIPASIMLLAIHGGVFTAVNPVNIFSTMRLIGKAYIGLYMLLLFMYGNQGFLENVAAEYISPLILIPVLVFIEGYFAIAIYTMMGYMIFQYHEDLGFDQVDESVETAEMPEAKGLSEDPFTNEITILIKEGMRDEAIKRLQTRLQEAKHPEYYEKLHKLGQLTGRVGEFLEYEKKYIELILADEKASRFKRLQNALNVYRSCVEAQADFYYPDAGVVFELGELAYKSRSYDAALRIFNGFHQRFPKSPDIPKAYLMLAKMLVDHRQSDKQAKQVLNFLLKKYPEDELVPEIREYLQLLVKVVGES